MRNYNEVMEMLDRLIDGERYENDGERNRLVLDLKAEWPVLEYQVEMVRMNRIPYVLPVEFRRVDTCCQLHYTVTGRWRLMDILDHREFTGKEYAALVEGLMTALTGAEVYLLEASQFLLDEEHIYLTDALEPQLVYIPAAGGVPVHQRFKELLLQMTVYRARISDEGAGPLLSGILNALKQEPFNLYDFQKRFRTLGHLEQCSSPTHLPASINTLLPPAERVGPSLESPASGKSHAPARHSETGMKVPEAAKPDSKPKGKRKKLSWPVAVGLLFQPLLAVGILAAYGPVLSATGEFWTTVAALSLMGICLDGLVLKAVMKQAKEKNQKTAGAPAQHAPQEKTQEEPKPLNFDKRRITGSLAQAPADFHTEILTQAPISPMAAETAVLSGWEAPPYLMRLGASQESILLGGRLMVLGRQSGLADTVVDDPTVGRMHAEIHCQDGRYLIRDMNSKNGTFLNDKRLSGQEYEEMNVGDRLRLGSVEYRMVRD